MANDIILTADVYLYVRLFEIWVAQYANVQEDLFVLVVLVTGYWPSVRPFNGLLEPGNALGDFREIQLNAIADIGVVDEGGKPGLRLIRASALLRLCRFLGTTKTYVLNDFAFRSHHVLLHNFLALGYG